jgi:hypothetical protein
MSGAQRSGGLKPPSYEDGDFKSPFLDAWRRATVGCDGEFRTSRDGARDPPRRLDDLNAVAVGVCLTGADFALRKPEKIER